MIRNFFIYFVGALIAVMPVVCVVSGLRYPNDDLLYPFWSHVLFAAMPFESVAYTMKVYALDEQVYPGGIDDYDIRGELRCKGVNAFKLIFSMGSNKYWKNEAEFFKVQSFFYDACFKGKRKYVKYSINRATRNILDYWKNRRNLTEVELGTYEFISSK